MGKRRQKERPETRKTQDVERKADGTFAKGVSGCPGGRPADADEIIALARIDSTDAYAKVSMIMRDDGNRQQLAAALAILKLAGVFRGVEAGESRPVLPAAPISEADLAEALSPVH